MYFWDAKGTRDEAIMSIQNIQIIAFWDYTYEIGLGFAVLPIQTVTQWKLIFKMYNMWESICQGLDQAFKVFDISREALQGTPTALSISEYAGGKFVIITDDKLGCAIVETTEYILIKSIKGYTELPYKSNLMWSFSPDDTFIIGPVVVDGLLQPKFINFITKEELFSIEDYHSVQMTNCFFSSKYLCIITTSNKVVIWVPQPSQDFQL